MSSTGPWWGLYTMDVLSLTVHLAISLHGIPHACAYSCAYSAHRVCHCIGSQRAIIHVLCPIARDLESQAAAVSWHRESGLCLAKSLGAVTFRRWDTGCQRLPSRSASWCLLLSLVGRLQRIPSFQSSPELGVCQWFQSPCQVPATAIWQ